MRLGAMLWIAQWRSMLLENTKKSTTAMKNMNLCFQELGGIIGYTSLNRCLDNTGQVSQISGAELCIEWTDIVSLASAKTSSCTMNLVMMLDPKLTDVRFRFVFWCGSALKESQVERRSSRRYHYASNDVSSYYHIWNAASELLHLCMGRFGLPGMITVGKTLIVVEWRIQIPCRTDMESADLGFRRAV